MSTAYRPQAFSHQIDLDLSRNEGRPRISQIDLGPGEGGRITSRYPDTSQLRDMIAARHGVTREQVLVTAGGDDALFRCFLAARGGTVVSTTPSFEMIRRYAGQSRSALIEIPWWAGDFPVADLVEASERYMAVIVSPNNPTGSVIAPGDLRKVADAYVMVVLDAAYAEFADEDITPAALEVGNVVVVRTLSKAFGLAGLRVGYALGPAELIARVGAFGSPYSVSSLSAELACGVLADEAGSRQFLEAVTEERERLTALLGRLGCAPLPSQANFVLATDVDPDWLVSAAASLGVGLRRFPDHVDLATCVRITLPGDDGAYERLEATLRSSLAPEAILFAPELAGLDPPDGLSPRLSLGVVGGRGPSSVRHAMESVGARHAWMVGSTFEALAAARSVGAVPIGLAQSETTEALSGAARVVGSLDELEEVLHVAKV